MTHFFSVTVMDCSYIYFVITLHNAATCDYSPTLVRVMISLQEMDDHDLIFVCFSDLAIPTMSRSGWSKRSKSGALPGLAEPPQVQGVHVYLFWTKGGERYLSHTAGEVTAEELCISAAEAVGENDSFDRLRPDRSIQIKAVCFELLFMWERVCLCNL